MRTIGEDVAKRLAEGRAEGRAEGGAEGQRYADMEDVVRRAGLSQPQLEALATAGAFDSLGLTRREALWAAGAVSQSRPDRLANIVTGIHAPSLPGMSPMEETGADFWATGLSPTSSPTEFARPRLQELGVVTAAGLAHTEPDTKVVVAGVVTHRQRPATAEGVTFLNLEDETGLVNVICSQGVWARYRRVARSSPALLIRGRLERAEGVINVIAERLEHLDLGMPTKSRDFR